MKITNPFTGNQAEVYKYKIRYRDGSERTVYGVLYQKKLMKVTYALGVLVIEEVIENYLEVIYLGEVYAENTKSY